MDSDTSSNTDSDTSSSTDAYAYADSNSTPTSAGYAHPITNYFAIAAQIRTRKDLIPLPIHTFTINNNTAIHLAYDPSIRQITVDDAVETFGLPDLCPALATFLNKEKAMEPSAIHPIGGQCRVSDDCPLPFTELQVCFKVWIQNTEFHNPNMILPVQTLFCSPPDRHWTFGCYDTAIINHNVASKWPKSGLEGLCSICAFPFFPFH